MSNASGAQAGGEHTREVRFGLVMYGGVSLAIYINGVCHELFRAVRGRGVYRLLKALTDSDVIVDVLSGTSAGGVNGILLGYALANGCEFAAAAELWRSHGDISELLRKPDRPLQEYTSVFDSEGYYQSKLEEAFERLRDAPRPSSAQREDPSPSDEIDLFVTGTDFHGRIWSTTDDAGHPIQVKDHRTVFWLKHRKDRKEPFGRATGEHDEPDSDAVDGHVALAKLARITSCFPTAFAPVTVGSQTPVDRKLRRWAQLSGTGERVFIDGGVLDNKPFTGALRAISSRLSDRPIERCLLYVEPDPESFAAAPETVRTPPAALVALRSMTSIPAYESIADDLRALSAHNDSVRRVRDLVTSLRSQPEPTGEASPSYVRIRLAGLCERVFASMFARASRGEPAEDRREAAARAKLRQWYAGHVVDDAAGEHYLQMDIDFQLRRLMYVHYASKLACTPEQRALLRVLNRQIQLLEILRSAMEASIEEAAPAWLRRAPAEPDDAWAAQVWTEAAAALERVCGVAPPASYALVDRAHACAGELLPNDELTAFGRALRDTEQAPSAAAGSMLQHTQAFEQRLLARSEELHRRYQQFEHIDRIVHPIEVVAEIRECDLIDIERISPVDARLGFSSRAMKDKVCGQRVGHFGAFFKRSWRSNDILWGRLDGVCQLVQRLVDQRHGGAAVAAAVSRPASREALKVVVAELAAQPDALPLPRAERARLFDWLHQLCDDGESVRQAALARLQGRPQSDDDPRVWLVLAGQHEVLREDLGAVFLDAADEQLSWNLFTQPSKADAATRADLGFDPESMSFTAGQNALDPTALAHATTLLIRDAGHKVFATPETAAEYFRNRYFVARETLDAVPRVVVLDIMVRALIATRNALLQGLGERADAVLLHPLYQVFVGWPLRVLSGLSHVLRRAPNYLSMWIVSALAYCALSAAVIVFWMRPILYDDGKLQPNGLIVFVGIPLVLILAIRFVVAGFDGSSSWVKLARVVGWSAGALALLVSAPTLITVFSLSSAQLCTALSQACASLVPEAAILIPACACGGMFEAFLLVGRGLTLASVVLGVLSVGGAFGGVLRWLRRSAPYRAGAAGLPSSSTPASPHDPARGASLIRRLRVASIRVLGRARSVRP